jgi:zinc transport system substrate-binding protein
MELLEAAPHDHSDHGDEHEDEHDDHGHDEHEDEHDDHGHDEHSVDAHVWLGQENISAIAEEVRDQLSVILPEQAELFATNTETFQSDLEAIYSDFAENTSDKTPREFIVFHDAYNYMMQSAGMDMNLKVPFSENVLHESGTAHMAELIEEIELH